MVMGNDCESCGQPMGCDEMCPHCDIIGPGLDLDPRDFIEDMEPTKPKKPLCICLDFDGVIHSYSSGWTGDLPTDPPTPGAQDFCEELVRRGFEVVVCSTRANTQLGLDGIKAWLGNYQFPGGITVSANKPKAILYVDDRAFRFHGNWDDVLSALSMADSPKDACEPWNKSGSPLSRLQTATADLILAARLLKYQCRGDSAKADDALLWKLLRKVADYEAIAKQPLSQPETISVSMHELTEAISNVALCGEYGGQEQIPMSDAETIAREIIKTFGGKKK